MYMVLTDGAKKKYIFEIDVILACNINFTFTEYKHCPHRSVNACLPRPICTIVYEITSIWSQPSVQSKKNTIKVIASTFRNCSR